MRNGSKPIPISDNNQTAELKRTTPTKDDTDKRNGNVIGIEEEALFS